MSEKSPFQRLREINVQDKTEKKGGLTYLSWAWAVDQLLMVDPAANWEYHEPLMFGATMMVRCSVTAFGKTMSMHLPVMDHRNKAISNPDAFQINTAMQRCLVKAISLHGLGLYIYAGEDLPPGEDAEPEPGPMKPRAQDHLTADQELYAKEIATEISGTLSRDGVAAAFDLIEQYSLPIVTKSAVWRNLSDSERMHLKAEHEKRKPA